MRITVKDLRYSYDRKSKTRAYALDGVELTIDEGEIFGIIGHTGSGKSTFIQHLNGLIKTEPGMGSVQIGEFDLGAKNCDFKKLRSKVGMAFQYPENQLFAETVFDDVAFGLKNFFPEFTPEDTEKRVKASVELVGLNYESVRNKSPFELSGGQKRRVALAGVIAAKPEILILDEPVVGLDPIGKKEFLQLLRVLHENFVKTVIVVSHDMDAVADFCTRAAVFEKGKIAMCGTPREIFKNADALLKMGLDIPVTAYVARELEKKNVFLDTDFTTENFVSEIARLAEAKK